MRAFAHQYRLWLLALLLTALALLPLTLTLPQATYRYLFVFDISQSMNVTDVGPAQAMSRLALARASVQTALAALPCGSQAGLGLFTGHRVFVLFVPVEVCRNLADIEAALAKIHWSMAWEAKSEIAKGLFAGLKTTAQLGTGVRLVFLSDGHEAPPVHPQYRQHYSPERAGEIQGLIVGVGGPRAVPIPKLGPDDQVQGYWTADDVMQVDTYSLGRGSNVSAERMVGVDSGDVAARVRNGTEHLSALRETYLRELAVETGLDYLRLESPDQLAAQLQTTALAQHEPAAVDLRWLPALAALLLLAGLHGLPYFQLVVFKFKREQ